MSLQLSKKLSKQLCKSVINGKILTLIILSASLFVSTPTNAQSVKFGIKGGLNVCEMKLDKKVFDKQNQIGGFIGPTVKFSLPFPGFGVDASALYGFHQSKVTIMDETQTIKQQQITIPVNLRYAIGLGSFSNIFFFAGPQWGINVGEKDFKWKKGSSYSFKNSHLSINAGVGITILTHLQLNANYNIALGKKADVNLRNKLKEVGKQIIDKEQIDNNSWQIALAYYF